ncbi:nucleoside-binding protein [Marinifaba aquimaris]|uniref:nucleoside-binding protein n=1 Tax=Marinifaba aquimaris TaxID=2741323 RepID=UPI001FE283CA|nr:nucleoside-binding protein [Marinifaba aquimaris]
MLAKTIWSDFSITYLKGSHYEVGDPDRQVITFEHAAATNWGDSFFFMDRLESDNDDTETYAEWAPRLKISSAQLSFIQNLYLAPSAEIGDGFTHYLFGLSTDINISHFDFFKVSVFARNNDNSNNNEQLTLSWGVPVGPLYYDGFMDYTTSTANAESSMNLTSQLKYNVAPHLGLSSKLYLGVEYVYWQNKFGIDGVDEKNANLLIKYHF